MIRPYTVWPTFITISFQYDQLYIKTYSGGLKTLVSEPKCENPALQKLILVESRSANLVIP